MKNPRTTVNLLAAKKKSGEPVYEEVLVDHLSESKYKIVATPGIVLGIAAGDLIEVCSDNGEFRIFSRGGNLSIHLYGDNCLVDEHLHELSVLSQAIDGRARNLTVLTVPVKIGFSSVEKTLNDFCSRHHEVEWYYGNVYDESDGITPLNWWLQNHENGGH
jgi:Domain of unknown function (DUF4265)